jgi:AmiR/NasT family two-component response regulator
MQNGCTSEQELAEEMRLINRAKRALKLYLNMNESLAHRYIEKRAKDMHVTKKEIAKNILKTYEP